MSQGSTSKPDLAFSARICGGRVDWVRQSILLALGALIVFLLPGVAVADESRCAEMFPDVPWRTSPSQGPATVATAGMNEATAQRFTDDVDRIAGLVEGEIGGMEGTAVCLATPELSDGFSGLVVPGQRLHAAVFAEEKVFAISAVETRMVNDAIAFGLPQIGLRELAEELGLEDGYPEPLGSTIAHWYLARDIGRLDQYRSEMTVTIYLDDVTPEDRTIEDAMVWVGDRKEDPYLYDPQFVGSQMGVFIDFAVAKEGAEILRQPDQVTWAELEKAWRISIRDQFPRGDFGLWWGVGIFVGFIALAILLAWGRRRQKRREATRRPTPPADESLFGSDAGGGS